MNNSNTPSSRNLGSMLLVIIVAVVIAIVIYYVVYALVPSSGDALVLIEDPQMTSKDTAKAQSIVIQDPTSSLVNSYSGWLYIDNYIFNYGTPKRILTRGSNGLYMDLYLDSHQNNLVFQHKIRSFEGSDDEFKCIVKDIPLQTWVYFTVVMNSRNIDIYINGKLERSCVMNGVPIAPPIKTPLFYEFPHNETFLGQISKLYYYGRNLTSEEIYSNYSKGPFPDTSISL